LPHVHRGEGPRHAEVYAASRKGARTWRPPRQNRWSAGRWSSLFNEARSDNIEIFTRRPLWQYTSRRPTLPSAVTFPPIS